MQGDIYSIVTKPPLYRKIYYKERIGITKEIYKVNFFGNIQEEDK